jgi:uncharacterized protein (DUF302 family)
MVGYKRQVHLPYDEAVTKAREELGKEGFGVLTEVDVKATIKKKLNADFDNYIILGACNPPYAYQALQVAKDAGLMMPCNVVVFVDKGRTFVEAATPTVLMELIQNEKLRPIAEQIEAKLRKVVDSIG